MKKKLYDLFDLQKFSGNKRLEGIIDDAENRYGKALSDDDLELISAAGEPSSALIHAKNEDKPR